MPSLSFVLLLFLFPVLGGQANLGKYLFNDFLSISRIQDLKLKVKVNQRKYVCRNTNA